MRIVRVAHFSLITHVYRDSCVLSIEVPLLLQRNSEEIERVSFVQHGWGFGPSGTHGISLRIPRRPIEGVAAWEFK
jgi:hypothetical protein